MSVREFTFHFGKPQTREDPPQFRSTCTHVCSVQLLWKMYDT